MLSHFASEPILNISGGQHYALETTFKLIDTYGYTQSPEFLLSAKKLVMTEEQEEVTRKVKSLELAMKNLQGLGGYKSVSYKNLCMFSSVNLSLGFKIPKFEKESLPGLASEWFVDQDIVKWNSWDDMTNEFMQQFQYNID
ncbi:hypothetical protein CQW23_16626 [Capsicum baccatum]|uniref:Uncharacterized protein n=1 Tax=Capsicum baccatum TaxID=33114 RepID=A0A2G2WBH3_CAPBA|nr:hypothetical protein CQW23_16626 [Capsicum baccatum]